MGRTAQIEVQEVGERRYEVTVDEFVSARDFTVTIQEAYYVQLARGRTPEQFIQDAFRFLLTREPKESILKEFDIGDIKGYFPEFEKEI